MKVCDKVIGVWGALHEEWIGIIEKIDGKQIDIRWETNGSIYYCTEKDIRTDYENPVGSPIGIYYE